MATASNLDQVSEIRACYENSMSFVAKALSEDEHGNSNLATEYYVQALKFFEQGIDIDLTQPGYEGEVWKTPKEQQRKMLKAHVQVKQRLYVIQENGVPQSPPSEVPAYSASVPEGHRSLTQAPSSSRDADLSTATELLLIPRGVQIFFVSSDDHVGTTPPSYPSHLRILVLDNSSQAFLQVGDWVYPLIKGQTPVLKMSNGAYIFPSDLSQGSAIGVVISNEVDEYLVETFENILENLSMFHRQETDEDVINLSDSVHISDQEESVSDKIAYGLEKGAEWISYGLGKGAEYTTQFVRKGSEKIKENLTPNEEPSTVDPNIQKGLYYTHEVSRGAVKVSRFLVNGLCAITSRVSAELAPHIKEYGNKILPTSVTEKSEDGSSTMDGVVKVAGAGLAGFGTVWLQLEKSGLAIARAVSSATVENVQFKYGSEAGKVTSHAMGSAVNVGKTAFNLDYLGIKAIAKKTATDTGKAVLVEYSKEAKTCKIREEEKRNNEDTK